MSDVNVTFVQIRFRDDERDLLDTYRRQQTNPPSRAQAARELVCRALTERPALGSEAHS
jgi:hypothetical protein